ncbi:MAG: hypothetical protein ACFFBH_12370 [Promethearchaeota archaeon]
MTDLDEQGFLNKLYEVVYKLSGIAKTQSYRFKKEWDENLKEINQNPHLVRQIQAEKEKFLTDIDYRIKVLNNVRLAFEDGFHSIKSLLVTLYQSYFNSQKFKEEFSIQDQLILKYLVAKKILGDLIQYNELDHESVPLKYNLIARNYLMMKLKEMREKEIINNLNRIRIDLKTPDLRRTLKKISLDGIIRKRKRGKYFYYTINKEIELSEEGNKKYNQTIRSLVEWPTLFWRSFYNIRELNVTVEGNPKFPDYLNKFLEKAATQGYVASHYVFQNLIKYYEKVKEEQK